MYHSPGQSGRKQTERIAERVHTRPGHQQSYNLAERMLRAQAIGRRNWTFLGSDRGGRTAAVLYSLIGTCKHHHIDPFTYLQDVLRRLPAHPADQLGELLPDVWFASHPSARRKRAA